MISLGRVFARKSPESTWDNLEICRLFSHNGRIRERPNRHLLHIPDLYLCWPPKGKHFWPSPNPIKGWSVQRSASSSVLQIESKIQRKKSRIQLSKDAHRTRQKIPEILERFLKPFVLLLNLEKIRRRNIELRLSVQQVWNATKSRWLACLGWRAFNAFEDGCRSVRVRWFWRF